MSGYVKKATGIEVDKFIPHWNGDGQYVVKAVALAATTASFWGQVVPTDSGYGFIPVGTLASTAYKFGVCVESGASGAYVDVALAGLCSGVQHAAAGTTAHSTFVKGDAIMVSDTGNLYGYGATWGVNASDVFSTVASDGGACVGIALSSGETTVVDMFVIEKPYVHPRAS
jgi:hypothetical protein